MRDEHRFRDEWLLGLVKELPAVEPHLAKWRAEKRPYLAQAIISAGIATFAEIGALVETRFHIPFSKSPKPTVDQQVRALVPEALVHRYDVFPLSAKNREVELAMSNPLDEEALQSVGWASGRRATPMYCAPADLDRMIREALSPDALVFNLLRNIDAGTPVEVISEAAQEHHDAAGRAPVITLVNAIVANAVHKRASDIHIEHDDQSSIVRFRIDGVLKNFMQLPRYLGVGPVVSRIKIMAGLDVADHMQPQDGRANLRVGADEIGLRVSTLPTRVGEKVVIRLLNEKAVQVSLSSLGFRPALLERLNALLAMEQGVLLVTGPTGSGKTTSLYAALNSLRSEKINIVTVEDPIEYRLDGVNQVQVNEKQGLTFPSVLRSVLRQDPDAILVGEIRDGETASVCMQAALTGHLVFSTLHTNDTIGAVARLVDLGVEPFKIASGLIGVTAQRLVRKLCTQCRVEAVPDDLPVHVREALTRAGLRLRHMQGEGCEACAFTGYFGRFPLLELLEITPIVRDLVARAAPDGEIRTAALAAHALHTIEEDAIWHLVNGSTSLEEVLPYVDPSRLLDVHAGKLEAPAEPKAPAAEVLSQQLIVLGIHHDATRDAVAALVRENGYDPVLVTDGVKLLAMLTRMNPQGVVVSHDLPLMDGPTAVRVIRAARANTGLVDVPIIGVVQPRDDAAQAAFAAAGASDVVYPDAQEIMNRLLAAASRREGWADLADVMKPHIPLSEPERIDVLRKTGLLEMPKEERFEALTRKAQSVFNVPITALTLVDADRQWFKSEQGLGAAETPRDISFCGHGINEPDMLVVNDAFLDPRFAENPLVNGGPRVRFYAGVPINVEGQNIGMFCIIGNEPRELTVQEKETLREFGRMAEREIVAGMRPA